MELLLLDFLTKHYVVLSTAAVLLASIIVMDLLFAYLSVFDYSLIWVTEYTDVAKFSLLSVSFLSAWGSFVSGYLSDFYSMKQKSSRSWNIIAAIGLALIIASNVFTIYSDVKSSNGQSTYHIFLLIFQFYILFVLYISISQKQLWAERNFQTILTDISSVIIAFGVFGTTFGHYVKDIKSQTHIVVTKKETFDRSNIVMLLSHHSIFLRNGSTIVIPSGDVESISTVSEKAPE